MGKMKQLTLGYGVSVGYGDEVALIGGENAKGETCFVCILLYHA